MKIYLGCSFANLDKDDKARRRFTMHSVAKKLEARGFEVYNPADLVIPHAWDYPEKEWAQMVFANDITKLDECDILVFLSYGKENNDGSVWECGYAFAKDKRVIVVHVRPNEPESLMVMNGSFAQVNGITGLLEYNFNLMQPTRIDVHENQKHFLAKSKNGLL